MLTGTREEDWSVPRPILSSCWRAILAMRSCSRLRHCCREARVGHAKAVRGAAEAPKALGPVDGPDSQISGAVMPRAYA